LPAWKFTKSGNDGNLFKQLSFIATIFSMTLTRTIDTFKEATRDALRDVCTDSGRQGIERILAANALLLREETLPGMNTRFEALFGRLSKDTLVALENEIPELAPATCRALAHEMKLRHMKTAQWFLYQKGDTQNGPMDFLTLENWMRKTEATEGISIWREGWPDWVPLSHCGFLTRAYFFKTEPTTTSTPPPNPTPQTSGKVKFPFMLGFIEMMLVPVWCIMIFVAPWGDSSSLGRAVHFILPLAMTGMSILTAIGFWAGGAWVVRFKLGTSVLALIYLLVSIFADDRGFIFKMALGLHLITLFVIFNFHKNNPAS